MFFMANMTLGSLHKPSSGVPPYRKQKTAGQHYADNSGFVIIFVQNFTPGVHNPSSHKFTKIRYCQFSPESRKRQGICLSYSLSLINCPEKTMPPTEFLAFPAYSENHPFIGSYRHSDSQGIPSPSRSRPDNPQSFKKNVASSQELISLQ